MIAEVIVDLSNDAVDKTYDYLATEGLHIGQRVLVPFGNRNVQGFCVGLKETTDCPQDKIKSVISTSDDFVSILPEQMQLADFMKKHYHLRNIDVLRLFIPSTLRNDKVKDKIEKILVLNPDVDLEQYKVTLRANAKNQLSLLAFMSKNKKERFTRLCKNFGASSVAKFQNDGVLMSENVQILRKPKMLEKQDKKIILSKEQNQAVDKIIEGENNKFVLFGVTRSGKTEVYMNLIQDALQNGKTALLLVPEIALTSALVATVIARFGDLVALIHSGLSAGERYDEWKRILHKQAKIVVGVRSAIFSPLQDIGVIIIDEEHDSSYFSESNPRYSTHEVAEFRASANGAKLILGSATPSIETFAKTQSGEYEIVELTSRVCNVKMPNIKIVDMRAEIANGNTGFLSYAMQDGIAKALEHGNQVMIFLNRRGYSSFQRCLDCGYVAKCSDCDVSLVVHKEDMQLKCHYCGKRYKILTKCPECKGEHLKQGAVGTEQIAELVQKQFPNVPVLRMDNDTTKGKNSHFEILQKFSQTKPAILVGTQMIAKGHDYPDVEFVGIVDADQSLHFSDYMANEKTFQLITQVAGRSGRGEIAGQVVLQTYIPKHYVYKFAVANAYKSFFERELNLRETTNFPPFAKILRVLFSGTDELKVRETLSKIFLQTKEIAKEYGAKIFFLSAMASPVKRIQNKYRYQILMRFAPQIEQELLQKIYDIIDNNETKNITIFTELNPQNLS